MNITKETLIQLIKEELAELQEQRIDREAEADADVRQSIARGLSRAGKTVAAKVKGLDPRTAQKKRAAGYKSMADKEFDDPREQVRIAAKYGAEHGADRTITEPDPPQAFAVDKEDIVYRAYINAFNRARAKNENRVPNADMLEEIILEEFEAVLSETSAGLDNLKKEIARVHRKMTNDGQTPKFLVARSGISDGEIQGFKSSGRPGVSDNWKWTVYLYDQGTIQRSQKEGVDAALSESDAMKDKAARAVWELYSQDKAARPDVRHPDGEAKEKRLTAKRQKKRLATGKARDDG